MTTYPAISLHQPWATLIAIGAKRYETRHWAPPTRVIGRRVAIHAAKRRPTRLDVEVMTANSHPLFADEHWGRRLPYGAVICTAALLRARLVDHFAGHPDEMIVFLEDGSHFMEDGLGNYEVGRWCWELGDVRPVDPPVPCVGRQGWFTWEGEP